MLAHGNATQGITGEVALRCVQTPTTHYPACTILSTNVGGSVKPHNLFP